jgi:5-methylcytosine-specific restriction endonuclease McrA
MPRGTTNQNERGNSYDRARRRAWLLERFGNGKTCPCAECGTKLTAKTITVDRIVPGIEGGRYVRGNIRPMCAACNSSLGARLATQRKRAA